MLNSCSGRARCCLLSAGLTFLLLAGCSSAPPRSSQPGPMNEPIDAFEAVGAPDRDFGAPQSDRDQLSTDIHRLQNARETYANEQRRLSAEMRREQAECRKRPDSRQVAIQDGTGDPNATYCEPAR